MSRPETALDRMRAWGEARDWRGYDPYDALNSPLAPYLTLGTGLGRRLFTQAVKLAPFNLRPALRIPEAWNAKAISLVASGYARLSAARDDPVARREAVRWLERLVDASTAEDGLGWGYHFDVQTRFFAYRRGTPNAIATCFGAHALLDGHELVDVEGGWGEAALEACDFLRETLLREDGERTYFRYLPREDELVHNANALVCSVLARTASVLGRPELAPIARVALASTLSAQSEDGSWPYSEAHGWVDNFHTGYVLEALAACEWLEPSIRPQLRRGLDFWERELFLADGTPKYFSDRVFPLDAHNFAQAIETWLAVTAWRPAALQSAERCALRLVDGMLARDGHVVFQRRRLWTNAVPFIRWTTAPAFRALAGLELAGARKGTP